MSNSKVPLYRSVVSKTAASLTNSLESKTMSKNVIVRNVTLNYPHLFRSHAPFGTDIFDVQIKSDNPDTIAILKDAGVNMKDQGDGTFAANVKRPVLTRKGEKNQPVQVVDSSKNPFDPDISIGNGTTANIKLFSYAYDVSGRSGVAAQLVAVQILDLVEYQGSLDFDDENEGDEAPGGADDF